MRFFKLISVRAEGESPSISPEDVNSVPTETYMGRSAMNAAQKTFSKICYVANAKECPADYIFSIREVGNHDKTYRYRGIRTKLDNPKKVIVGNTECLATYRSDIRGYTDEEEQSTRDVGRADSDESSDDSSDED